MGVSGGSALGGLGQSSVNGQLGALGLLGQYGQIDQNTQQKALDTGYQDFTDQRDWDINNAGKLSQLVRGVSLPTQAQTNTGNTTTEIGSGTSPASGLLALLSTLYGSTQK